MLQDVDWEVVRGVSPRFFWVYLHNRQHALPVLDRFLFPRVWYFLPISKSPRVASMGCFHQSRPWTAHSLANFTGHFFFLTFNGLVFAGNLQENPTLTGKIHGFRWRFSQENQSIETSPRSLGFELRKATEPIGQRGKSRESLYRLVVSIRTHCFQPPKSTDFSRER